MALLATLGPAALQAGAGPGAGLESNLPYQRALKLWSTGSESESSLLAVIRSNLERETADKVLARVETLHTRLAEQSLESVAAVSLLYTQALHESNQQDPVMTVLPRMALDVLGHLSAGADGAATARSLGSYVATEFGRSALNARLWFSAERYFEQAIAFKPGNAQALLGLGYFHELYGRHEQALHYYKQPCDEPLAETRLRRAVTQGRLERYEEAEAELEALGRHAEQQWIRSIAWQELGRQWINRGQLQQAAAVLDQALTIVPGDGHLTVLRAFVADQLGEVAVAEALVERTEQLTSPAEMDSRVRYSRPPQLRDEAADLAAVVDQDRLGISLQEALARIIP